MISNKTIDWLGTLFDELINKRLTDVGDIECATELLDAVTNVVYSVGGSEAVERLWKVATNLDVYPNIEEAKE